jgi:hypothetical protein
MINKLLSFIGGVFKDENGTPSSKRIAGLICVVTLCLTMYHNSFSPEDIAPSTILVESVAMLAFGCLGLASVDKIWGKSRNNKTETETQPTNTSV